MSNWTSGFLNHCARLAHAALPQQCVLCASAAGPTRLCEPCAASLPTIPAARCGVCAAAIATGTVCGRCLDDPPHFDGINAAFAYEFPIDALIQSYKYGGDLSLAPVLAKAMTDTPMPVVDALVPMPLSDARLRERGFNQAHEIARIAGRRLKLPVLARACRKVTDTPPQAALPWKARAGNVRNAFVCEVDLTGKRVAIVDDVMTTGATINELARNLKLAGAAYVGGWVAARTQRLTSST